MKQKSAFEMLVERGVTDKEGTVCTPEVQAALLAAKFTNICDMENTTWEDVLLEALQTCRESSDMGVEELANLGDNVQIALKSLKQ